MRGSLQGSEGDCDPQQPFLGIPSPSPGPAWAPVRQKVVESPEASTWVPQSEPHPPHPAFDAPEELLRVEPIPQGETPFSPPCAPSSLCQCRVHTSAGEVMSAWEGLVCPAPSQTNRSARLLEELWKQPGLLPFTPRLGQGALAGGRSRLGAAGGSSGGQGPALWALCSGCTCRLRAKHLPWPCSPWEL